MIIISLILSFIFGALLMFLVFCLVASIKDKKPKNNVHFYIARDKCGELWFKCLLNYNIELNYGSICRRFKW